MASPLLNIALRTPGNRGIIIDQADAAQSHEWSFTLRNAVVNESKRIAARNGWQMLTFTGGHGEDTGAIYEFIVDDSESYIVSAADTGIYSGTDTLINRSDKGTGYSGGAQPYWQFVTMNGKCYGFQQATTPVVWDPSGATYDANDFQDLVPGTGTAPDGDAAVATHGRIFAFDSDKQTIKWCALLNDDAWSGTGAGQIDLSNVWPVGVDLGVALVEWNDFLVVFGERSVLIYSGLDDPNSTTRGLVLASATASSPGVNDMITGDGLVHRDAVVSTGTDLIYLSRSGLRTLRRGLEFDRLPMSSIAPHLQRQLSTDISDALGANLRISMTYHRPISAIVATIGTKYWYFDVRDLSVVRASQWDSINHTCAASIGSTLYLGQNDGIAQYAGYLDDTASYQFEWLSPWMPVGGTNLFIPKRMLLSASLGLTTSVQVRWGWDYANSASFESRNVPIGTGAEWGIFEWGIGEWGPAGKLARQTYDLGGSGSLLQLGIICTINGGKFEVQQIDLVGKQGRVYR